MNCKIRRWELYDARDLAATLSNKKIQDNLRDGLPYSYTEQDGKEFISAMLAANESDMFAFTIMVNGKVIGSIGAFVKQISIIKQLSLAITLRKNIGVKEL